MLIRNVRLRFTVLHVRSFVQKNGAATTLEKERPENRHAAFLLTIFMASG